MDPKLRSTFMQNVKETYSQSHELVHICTHCKIVDPLFVSCTSGRERERNLVKFKILLSKTHKMRIIDKAERTQHSHEVQNL